jgi:hypothetical protein
MLTRVLLIHTRACFTIVAACVNLDSYIFRDVGLGWLSHTYIQPHTKPQVLYDLGVVSTKEPFGRLVSQGMILGEVEFTVHRYAYTRARIHTHTSYCAAH